MERLKLWAQAVACEVIRFGAIRSAPRAMNAICTGLRRIGGRSSLRQYRRATSLSPARSIEIIRIPPTGGNQVSRSVPLARGPG
jgi:hypothetical protein